MSSWVEQQLFPLSYVSGIAIPQITPNSYRVKFSWCDKDGNELPANNNNDKDDHDKKFVKFHSQFSINCCNGFSCCYSWCCLTHMCSGEKDLFDVCVPSADGVETTLELLFTTAFPCCKCCCEVGKVFHCFQTNGGKQTVLVTGADLKSNLPAGGEVFVCSATQSTPVDEQKVVEEELVKRGFRKAGEAAKLHWL